MADIFISYAREDRPQVERLAAALREAGLTCWWDKELAAGQRFLEETERELNNAKAVLVVWTKHSISSHWVADEAGVGRDSGRLAPISLDGSMPPLGFRQFQVIDFTPWSHGDQGPVRDLVAALARFAPEAEIHQSVRPPTLAARLKPWLDKRILIPAGALLAALVVGLGIWGLQPRPQQTAAQAASHIAVLRFTTGGDTTPVFADEVAEELIGELAQIPGLKITARSSSFALNGDEATPAGAAKALGVNLVLTGSVRRTDEGLRVQAGLVEAPGGTQMWTHTFERPLGEIFQLERDIAVRVAQALDARLNSPSAPSVDPQAYNLFLKAEELRKGNSQGDTKTARDLYRQAVERDPKFLKGWEALTYIELDMGQAAVMNAPADAPITQAEFQPALDAANKALALDPRASWAMGLKAVTYMFLGRPKEAREQADLATKIDGRTNFAVYTHLGYAAEALTAARAATVDDPLNPRSWGYLEGACRLLGDTQCQVEGARRSIDLAPSDPIVLGYLVYALAESGDLESARKIRTDPDKAKMLATFFEINAPVDARYLKWMTGDGPPVPTASIIKAVKSGAAYVDPAVEMLDHQKDYDAAAKMLDQWGSSARPSLSYLYRKDAAPLRKTPQFWKLMDREGLTAYWRESGKWPDFCETEKVCPKS